jgi:hypothetical protein
MIDVLKKYTAVINAPMRAENIRQIKKAAVDISISYSRCLSKD